jgi:hypothetical protein
MEAVSFVLWFFLEIEENALLAIVEPQSDEL